MAADGRAQCRIGAVDLVAGHPRCGRVGLDRAADQHFGQGGFGRETPSISGDSSLLAAVSILGPRLGQVQGAVDQRVSTRRRVGQIDRDLGVLDPPGGAAVLALHPHRRGALLDVAGLVDHQHRTRVTERVDDVVAQVIAHRLGVPLRPRQQVLQPVR